MLADDVPADGLAAARREHEALMARYEDEFGRIIAGLEVDLETAGKAEPVPATSAP